jgi:hypothetical protein
MRLAGFIHEDASDMPSNIFGNFRFVGNATMLVLRENIDAQNGLAGSAVRNTILSPLHE